VVGKGQDATLAADDRRKLVLETLQHLWELILRRWSEPIAVSDELANMTARMNEMFAVMTAFRQESHEEHREILESLGKLQKQLKSRLEAQGVPEAQAKELADTKSPTFMKRIARWTRSSKARDAAEAALWAALDFVPGGTTVKLGVKLAAAVRKATK
jgi:hypothetical protein